MGVIVDGFTKQILLNQKEEEERKAALDAATNKMADAYTANPDIKVVEPGNEPTQDAYTFNQDFINQYVEKPLDEETRQKRNRGAYTRAGIGALGNALNSFSNLFFTGHGAPSQTLPQSPDAHTVVKDFNNEQRSIRDNYVNKYLQGRAADNNEYAQDFGRYTQKVGLYNTAKQYLDSRNLEGLKAQYASANDAYKTSMANRQYYEGMEQKERMHKADMNDRKATRAQQATFHNDEMTYRNNAINAKIANDNNAFEGVDGNPYMYNIKSINSETISGILTSAGVPVTQQQKLVSTIKDPVKQLEVLRRYALSYMMSNQNALDYAIKNKIIVANPNALGNDMPFEGQGNNTIDLGFN